MNKQDTLIVAVLVALLLGWLYFQHQGNRQRLEAARAAALERAAAAASQSVATNILSAAAQSDAAWVATPATNAATAAATAAAGAAVAPAVVADEPPSGLPERSATLRAGTPGEAVELTLSSKGATLRAATLLAYRALPGSTNAVRLDFEPLPALALAGLPGLGANADYEIVSATGDEALLRATSASGLTLERRIALRPGYRVEVGERLLNAGSNAVALPPHTLSLGTIRRGSSKNDMLAVDSLAADADARGRAPKVTHWETKLPAVFTGGRGGGCGGAPAADLLPETSAKQVDGAQEWIALKSRFFVQTFSSSATNSGFGIALARVPGAGPLRLDHVGAQMRFAGAELAPGAALERSHTLYIGPKKLSLLRRLGHRTAEIMQFGTFKWMCVLLVPTLNFFHELIPNYGVAIILLTLLVRVVFWPLTHKSTEGMKRMQALQPKLNELKTQFKNDPQKLQQETWKIYRENKVNPMSSCLPMLVQIPVFIALFTVLRSAVELRYAPFLWIADLSEPENLLKGVLPVVPALNILPFFMAGTMILQSRLTPSMGDPAQQKMMMWMMPAMMLFMFYSMPSALVLYWTVSQVLAIVQLAWQRRKGAAAAAVPAPAGGAPDSGLTRQARRRLAR